MYLKAPKRRQSFFVCLSRVSQRAAFERDAVAAVHDAVKNGVGQGRIVQIGVPRLHRQLTGDQGRLRPHPVIKDFEQVVSLCRAHGRDRKVINHQHIEFGQLRHAACKAAVAVGNVQLIKEATGSHVERREA